MPDLETATIEEIWDEMCSRFDGIVLTFQQKTKLRSDEWMFNTWWHTRIGVVHALGLSEYATGRIRNELDVRMRFPEGGPDDDG